MVKSAFGLKGASTDSYLASKVALEVLEEGENAFDVAVAASAVLSIVLPQTGGLGGDGFLLAFMDNNEVLAYASSGRAPSGLDAEEYLRLKPERGPLTVTVPGLADLWGFVNEEFCTLPLDRLLRPAILLAYNGFYAGYYLADSSKSSEPELRIFKWAKYFKGIEPGAYMKNREAAQTLRIIASRGWDEFYRGKIAEKFVSELQEQGVNISLEDMERHRGTVVKPLRLEVEDGKVLYELPPNTQGVTTLQAISAIYELDLTKYDFKDSGRISFWTKISEDIYAFRDLFIGDCDYMKINIGKYLTYNKVREALSGKTLNSRVLNEGDTTFFIVSDGESTVGFIQSLAYPFGSGLVALGFPIQNRGYGFAKKSGLPNSPAPRKRPLHTLSILGVKDAKKTYIIGCAGGDWRPQIHTRIYENIFVYGMNPAKAIDAPRFIYERTDKIFVEPGTPKPVDPKLTVKEIEGAGFVHIVVKDLKSGVSEFAADPRIEGIALAS